MATTREIEGSNPNRIAPFSTGVKAKHPMDVPSGCLCVWIVKVNRVRYLKYESALCPFKGRH
jgi:hypothetical protein